MLEKQSLIAQIMKTYCLMLSQKLTSYLYHACGSQSLAGGTKVILPLSAHAKASSLASLSKALFCLAFSLPRALARALAEALAGILARPLARLRALARSSHGQLSNAHCGRRRRNKQGAGLTNWCCPSLTSCTRAGADLHRPLVKGLVSL